MMINHYEAERDRLREECSTLFDEKIAIEARLAEIHDRLRWLDDMIDGTGASAISDEVKVQCEEYEEGPSEAGSMIWGGGKFAPSSSSMFTQPEDFLTDPHTQRPLDVGIEHGSRVDDDVDDENDDAATLRNRSCLARDGTMMMRRRLRETFGIAEFRGHQEEIINATMRGEDVFVVMRTGGGKSLTYQLPAVMECYHYGDGGGGGLVENDGRRSRMVTVVISPLVSLIRDQEEQMNSMIPGSALSFTSAMSGGTAEQARRWRMVRDPNGGVALIFVTPERVGQSNRFRGEMEKLHDQGRLGRFVIDEW
jgi:superfamily II DNA helicase RecQ